MFGGQAFLQSYIGEDLDQMEYTESEWSINDSMAGYQKY